MASRRRVLAASGGLLAVMGGAGELARRAAAPDVEVTRVWPSDHVDDVTVDHARVGTGILHLQAHFAELDTYPAEIGAQDPDGDLHRNYPVETGAARAEFTTHEKPGEHLLLLTDGRDVLSRVRFELGEP